MMLFVCIIIKVACDVGFLRTTKDENPNRIFTRKASYDRFQFKATVALQDFNKTPFVNSVYECLSLCRSYVKPFPFISVLYQTGWSFQVGSGHRAAVGAVNGSLITPLSWTAEMVIT